MTAAAFNGKTAQRFGLLLEGEQHRFEGVGDSSTSYRVEIQVFRSAGEGGDLEVSGATDDGGLRALSPVPEDFILSPSGHFVGDYYYKIQDDSL